MKKLICLLIILFFSFTLSGCNILLDIVGSFLFDETYEYPDYDYDNIKTVSDLYTGYMPSTGKVQTLVLLVEFPDAKHDEEYSVNHMKTIFRKVYSYYRYSSYSNLSITGDVYGWYETSKRSSTYEYIYGSYASDVILKEVLDYYVYNNLINLYDYDSNNDGFVDGVSVIYSRKYKDTSDTWWAYQTPYSYGAEDIGYLEYGGMKISNYLFASAHFLGEDNDILTYVHETGHLMGLDDYYDYNEVLYSQKGLGGADMMDENVGDHCSISKMILGWVDPIIVDTKKSNTYRIEDFTSSGNVLLVPKGEYNGIFDEYYLIELYSPQGLNETSSFFTKTGIRILHVDATIGDGGMDGDYFTYFNCDNTDTKHPFVDMVRKKKSLFNFYASDDDLFYPGDVFDEFVWYDDEELNIRIVVQNIVSSAATIEVIVE